MDPLLSAWRDLWKAHRRSGDAYRVLGLSKSAWSEFLNGKRRVPDYLRASIETHLVLARTVPGVFDRLMTARVRECEKNAEFDAAPEAA